MNAEAASLEQVHELLEWSPTVIVAEHSLTEVISWGIKIDVVLSPTEKVSELAEFLHDQSPVKIISFNNLNEALSTGLYFLMARKQTAVNVISTAPLKNFESFLALDISVFQSGTKWSFIRSGHFEKWLPAGRTVNTYPNNNPLTTSRDGIVAIQQAEGFWVSEE
jgi:thiamine pyrophosphokinase